jgi:hypothetical protein
MLWPRSPTAAVLRRLRGHPVDAVGQGKPSPYETMRLRPTLPSADNLTLNMGITLRDSDDLSYIAGINVCGELLGGILPPAVAPRMRLPVRNRHGGDVSWRLSEYYFAQACC